MKYFGCIVLYLILFIKITPAGADIYMYMDSNGVLHFTNTPTSSHYKLYMKEKPKKSPTEEARDRYDHLISEASHISGLSFALIKAMIRAESNFDHKAVSKKGAMGLMQIMPKNFAALDIEDPFDPRENIIGGSLYFQQLMDRYHGKIPMALAAYNAGPTAVDRYRGIPPIPETEDYVAKVINYFHEFQEK